MIRSDLATIYNRLLKKIVVVLGIFWGVVLSFVLAYRSCFSVFGADDFYNAQQFGGHFSSLLDAVKNGFACLIYNYKFWQGTYSGALFSPIFSGLSGFGEIQQAIVMCVSNVVFIISLILFFNTFFCEKRYNIIGIAYTGIVVIAIFFSGTFPEVFTWYTGMIVYLFPVTALLFSLAILYRHGGISIALTILAIIFGLLGMGGSLVISGMGCFLLMLKNAELFFQENRIDKKRMICFLFYFVFALLNTMAPGNFSRKALNDSNPYSLKEVIVNTALICLDEWRVMFIEHKAFVFLLIIILFFFIFDERIIKVPLKMLAIGCLYVFLPFVVLFPYVLGTSNGGIADRVRFILDLSFLIAWTSIAKIVAGVLRSTKMNRYSMLCSAFCLIAMIGSFCINTNNGACQMLEDIHKGIYIEYHDACFAFFDELEKKTGDVVITDYPAPVRNMYAFFLPENVDDHWICIGISKYYGYSSLKYVP